MFPFCHYSLAFTKLYTREEKHPASFQGALGKQTVAVSGTWCIIRARLLIEKHPRQRFDAALVPEPSTNLTADDLTQVLGRLAFHMQCQCAEGIIDRDAAVAVVREYLEDPDGNCGWQPGIARMTANQMLTLGAETLGILLRK
jgi:hypothetical protein